MNTVSFGSTFKISSNNHQNQSSIADFCAGNDLDYSYKVESHKHSFYSAPVTKVNTTIIAPDDKDNLIETFLANKGIKFNKLDAKELFDKSNIEKRVDRPTRDMKLVKIDAKKFEKLIQNQDQNIDYCESTYDKYYKDSIDSVIKSGDKMPATTLYITPMGESTEDTVRYIHSFGEDRLNDNQLSFIFNQESFDKPDQCMFFGMKDLGMDKIPVYMNEDSYKLANALGIVAK